MSHIGIWAEEITKSIYQYSRECRWRHGIKVFYSPVTSRPSLLIIGYQPGGDEEDFKKESKADFEKGDFRLPEANEYIERDYLLAEKVKDLFGFKGGMDILKKSVVFQLIFFRAPSIDVWIQEAGGLRREMEDFCFQKVEEILRKIEPKRILVLGMGTYDALKKIFGGDCEERNCLPRRKTGERMCVRASFGGHEILAVMHPSGARIKKEDRLKMQSVLAEFIQ